MVVEAAADCWSGVSLVSDFGLISRGKKESPRSESVRLAKSWLRARCDGDTDWTCVVLGLCCVVLQTVAEFESLEGKRAKGTVESDRQFESWLRGCLVG